MRRLLLGAALSVVAAPAALACAGGDCDSEPAPLIAELKGGKTCYGIFGFGVPFLNPYNDTRVNLALLLEDRKLFSLADKPPPSAPPNYSPSAPQNGTPAPPLYPVPFWLKSYRDLKDEWSGTPPPPPERDALLARAAALGIDGKSVDEIVFQTYRGRQTIPGYRDYLAAIARLRLPFKIGIVEGGAWDRAAEGRLASSPFYRGVVVFLTTHR